MIRSSSSTLALTLALMAAASPALAQTDPNAVFPAPLPPQEEGVDVEGVIVTARRPGYDPSQATTECIWARLPSTQRDGLSHEAEVGVRTLAQHDNVPLTSPALTDEAVAAALLACGGSGRPEHLPFVRVGLAAYASEKATASALARNRVPQDKLLRAWGLLSEGQKDAMLATAANPQEEPEDMGLLISAVFKVLRAVRPLSTWNPMEYRNGTTTHRIVYFYEAHAARTAMERRF